MALTSVLSIENKIPGTYTRVSLGVGVRTNGSGTRHVVIVGNKTSAGSMLVEKEYDCYSEDDARDLAGAGSELFIAARAAIKAWPGVSVKLYAIAESAGAAATGTITATGTTASAGGTITVVVLGELIEVAYATGATPTNVAAAIVAAINSKTDWPVTAANTAGVVTVTAKNLGPRGNFLVCRVAVISGAGIALAGPTNSKLSAGTTSDDPQNVLDAIAAYPRRYVVAPYADATQLAKFRTHVQSEDEPEVGHRKRVICASTDTPANTITLSTGLNEPRMHMAWQENADVPPVVLAAAFAARIAARESVKVSYNFDGEQIPGLPPHFLTARPKPSALNSALNSGITPLQSQDDGSVTIIRAITTKCRDANSNADFRVLDIAKVAVTDECADRVDVLFYDRFKSYGASVDPTDGDVPQVEVVTPSMCRDLAFGVTVQMESEGLLEFGSAEANKDRILYELSLVSPGRFNGVIPLDVVEGAHQYVQDIRQIG